MPVPGEAELGQYDPLAALNGPPYSTGGPVSGYGGGGYGGGGCDGGCYDPVGCDGTCGPSYAGYCGPNWSYWGSFEFLLWWRQAQSFVPLVTTSPATTPIDEAGVLGPPGTQILYPGNKQSGAARPGGRLTLGVWFHPCGYSGVGGRFYSLGETTANYNQSSDVVPVLARPFNNVSKGQQDAFQIAYPGSFDGSISVQNTSNVSGGDAFYRRLLYSDGRHRLDIIGGYQFARLDSDLRISTQQTVIDSGGSIPFGTTIQVGDIFDTRNQYHAGEVGLWWIHDRGPFTYSVLAKVGLGNMNRRISISGSSTTTVPGLEPSTRQQGLLALSTNSGVYEQDKFVAVPEVALQGSYHLNQAISLTFGYTFIGFSQVAMPGDQIDFNVNPTQITGDLVGPANPTFLDSTSSYHLHGLNFGVQWVW